MSRQDIDLLLQDIELEMSAPRGYCPMVDMPAARAELERLRARDATLSKVEEVLRNGGRIVGPMSAQRDDEIQVRLGAFFDWSSSEDLDEAVSKALAAHGKR